MRVFPVICVLFLTAAAVVADPQAREAAPADPDASVYLVSSRDTYVDGVRTFARSAAGRRDSLGNRLVIAEIPEHRVGDVSRFVHESEGRCGGFFAFTTRAEAEAFVRNDLAARAVTESFLADYTIDNQDTVGPWLQQVEEAQIRASIQHLSTAYPNRYYASPYGENAAVWIHNTWLALADGREDVSAELFTDCGNCANQPSVILTIEGGELADEIVVLGGHLDSIRSGAGGNPEMDAPGADDDASGIATLTEVLRVAMAGDWKPKRTVKFMGYAAEEVGLRGSHAIAQSFSSQGRNVVGVLQLDMTNYAAGASVAMRLLTDFSNPALQQFSRDLFDEYLGPLGLTRGTYTCGYACSDHASWTSAGYPSVMMFEPTFNTRLHTPNDTLPQMGGTAASSVNFAMFGLAFLGELGKTEDEEAMPGLVIDDPSVEEGDGEPVDLRFTVTLSKASTEAVSFDYETVDGTAEAGVDYLPASGTATVEPGALEATIDVPVLGNLLPQPDRTLFLDITNPVNATIVRATGKGTIVDDDGPLPGLTINDSSVAEGDGEPVDLRFTVTLSKPFAAEVSFDYETSDGTAEAGVDYEPVSGTVTVAPGALEATIDVPVLGNVLPQPDRTLFLEVTNPVHATIVRGTGEGTILDDDGPLPGLSIDDPSVAEGDGEPVDLRFTVTLSKAFAAEVSFRYETVDGTAEAGVDYQPVSGIAPVESGVLEAKIDVPVLGNFTPQPDRSLFLEISDPVNAAIVRGTGEGTILDDDEIEQHDLDPSSGAAAGGEVVLVTGRSFFPGVAVEFGGTPASAVDVLSATEIEAITPPLDVGELVDVRVVYDDQHDLAPTPRLRRLETRRFLADFLDVPRNHPFHDFVEILRRADVAAGCGNGQFCVASSVNRAQMSVFLLKALFGNAYQPPACSGLFDDVPCPSTFAGWIEDLHNRGITGGCQTSPMRYCPGNQVTRGQMSVFLLKTLEGEAYAPPPCGGLFEDVACPSAFADWIEALVSREITAGCSAEPSRYCPANGVTRGQMAAFLVKTFAIPFEW